MTDITANIPDAQLERIESKIVATVSRQLVAKFGKGARELQASNNG